jgi:hypothetical protein
MVIVSSQRWQRWTMRSSCLIACMATRQTGQVLGRSGLAVSLKAVAEYHQLQPVAITDFYVM